MNKSYAVLVVLLSVSIVNAGGVGPQGPKGDKGDTGPIGPQGIQGIQGIKGDTGATGAQGIQGVKGLAGAKGNTGAAGTNGTDGTNGVKGVNGVNGSNGAVGAAGTAGAQGAQGNTGVTGIAGVAGLNGKDVDPAIVNGINSQLGSQADAINKLQQTKLLIEQDIRLYDGKRTTIAAFNSYDLNAGHGFAQGLRITIKAGTSYEERLLAKQQDTLKEIKFVNFELSKRIAEAEAMMDHINNLAYKTVVIQERVNAKGQVLSRNVVTGGLR